MDTALAALLLVVAVSSADSAATGPLPGLDSEVITGTRPIWELVRSSDALRAFMEHRAADAPGPLSIVVDTGSAAALRRAQDAVEDLRAVNDKGPFIFVAFHRTGVSEPQVLPTWTQLQEAVAAASASLNTGEQGRANGPGPLDAILTVASVAPRGTRIILVTENDVEGRDREDVDTVARALKSNGIELDAWSLGGCSGYQALANVSRATGGMLGCGELFSPQHTESAGKAQMQLPEAEGTALSNANHTVEKRISKQMARRDATGGLKMDAEWESTGQTGHGEVLTRASNLTKVDNVVIVPPVLDIELNPTSRLIVRQGENLQLSYDLTNNRDYPQLFQFRMKDNQAFLLRVLPFEALIPPRQTIQVVGNLYINQNAADGQIDKVTFIARSASTQQEITKEALLYVQQEQINDVYNPSIWGTWKSTCSGAWDSSNCNTNTWTIDFAIRDRESGLLSVTSNPRGIQFRTEFISGTREEVHGFYSASCCSKKVDITATDLKGNANRQTFDVGTQFLSPGEIAGISVGVIAIILIIAVIVLAILLCRKRESLRLERRLSSRLASRETR